MIAHSILDTIGHTPVVALSRFSAAMGLSGCIYAKLERANPGGSAKDRVALSIIRDAEASGRLKPGGTIIEATSGNTGVGLAMAGAVLGYRVVIVMPDTMSVERQKLIAAYGAKIVLTDGALGMAGANKKAEQLAFETENSVLALQFDNPANPHAHFCSTGPELYADMDGQLDALIATVGTGGTLSGTGSFLRTKLPNLYIAAVEPAESPLLSEGRSGPHGIQGIGANFVPSVLDRSLYNEVIPVSTDASFKAARLLSKTEGILCGISSGAALAASVILAKRSAFSGKRLAVILTDTGERYLSTGLFD